MSNPGQPGVNVQLIQSQGRQIIHKLRQEIDNSSSLIVSDSAREQLMVRAKNLVEADRSGLGLIEKAMMLQYVRDCLSGQVDPDSRLLAAADNLTKAGVSASSLEFGRSLMNMTRTFLPGNSSTAGQKFMAAIMALFLVAWFLFPWLDFAHHMQEFGGTFYVHRFISAIFLSLIPFIAGTVWFVAARSAMKSRKNWNEHPETREQQLKDLQAQLKAIPERNLKSRQYGRNIGAFLALALMCGGLTLSFLKEDSRKTLHHFATPSVSLKRDDSIDYTIDLAHKWYYVYVPKSYDASKPSGLIVYTSSGDDYTKLPVGWSDVLDAHNVIFIAPQDAGNHCPSYERYALSVLGALAAMNEYKIDPSRVFVAGFSGGSREANAAAFLQNDLFTGAIESCGTDFYRAVPHVKGTNWIDSNGNRYGIVETSDENALAAKSKVKFVLITGPKDFRYGNIQDIYNGGFHHYGFKCKLIDDPKMGHEDCSAQSLDDALNFLTDAKGK